MLLRLPGRPKLHTLVDPLLTRRHIHARVPLEEIHGLQIHPEDLGRHDGPILGAHDMLHPELDPHHDVVALAIRARDGVLPIGPGAHALAAAGLVGVHAAGVELAVAVLGHVDVVVGELGALVVEGLGMGEHLLEGRGVDLVGDRFAVDGVEGIRVGDLEDAVGGRVDVETGGLGDGGFVDGIAHTMRVEVVEGHWMDFGADEGVGMTVYGWVDAEGKDVLVEGC